MKQIKNLSDLEEFQNSLNGRTVALIPTMGALHEGHLALVKVGMKAADVCLPYIFLNPTQFAAGEDLDSYPQTLQADLEKLEKIGTQTVWLPSMDDVYPDGPQITHKASDIAKPLEGESRPHFFDGVATVLARMFVLSKPDIAIFGEKDFQQLQVIRAMVRDYNLPIQIIGAPTARDENGLALSSRNVYLSEGEYQSAIQLNKIIKDMAHRHIDEEAARVKLLKAGFDKIDYITARNSKTFHSKNPDRILAAAWLGKTRLIDNMAIIP